MKRSLTLTAIVSIIFFNVSGGPYGLESVLKNEPGLAMLLNLRGARTVGNFGRRMALMILSPIMIRIGCGFSSGGQCSPDAY